jgi:ABC-type bacteriocin/lantibiotic exporter with double-glycine peptidase domain
MTHGIVYTWVAARLRHYWPMILAALLIQMTNAGLSALQPLFFQRIVSLVASSARSFPLTDGLRILGELALIYLFTSLLQALGGYITARFSSDLFRELQVEFFGNISRLPLQRMQKQAAGELFTRFSADTSQAQRFISTFIPSVVQDALCALIVVIILLRSCPLILTVSTLLIVAITGALTAWLQSVLEPYARMQRAQYGRINTLLDETIQGIDTLKTLASEERRGHHFEVLATDFRDVSMRFAKVGTMLSSGVDLLSKTGGLLLIALSYYLLNRGRLVTDVFLLYFFYAGMLQHSISSLVNAFATFQPQVVGIENVARFFAQAKEEDDQDCSMPAPSESVAIELSGLTFGYSDDRPLFRNANLVVPPRSITLIHGPSGSGKSTLINLLLRFLTCESGMILIDKVPIDLIASKDLRRSIGVVLQSHFVFGESLRDNIRIAKPEANDNLIRDALHRAHLDSLLNRLSCGLDSQLDPRGNGLSGGERQRISIARVLLRDSAVMVFDEPWSNLDDDARRKLAMVLNECRMTKTILIMSHEDIPSLDVDQVFQLVPSQGVFTEESRIDSSSCDNHIVNHGALKDTHSILGG